MDKIFDHKPVLGVNEIFEYAKETSSQERLLKSLYKIFTNANQSTFILEFLQCVAVPMTYMEKQPPVENALDFAAKYCVYHGNLVGEEDNVLLLAMFEFIFDNHNRKQTAIRYRTCEFVNRLLNKMGPQATLDDDIFEKMASSMLERLQDKIPSIRAQAVLALQRLQDPPNKSCRIIKAFSFHIEADPSSDVRIRVLQNIAVTQRTLPLLLGRLQDLKETVRKEAYKALNRLKPQKITIRQRQALLTSGLSDRSDLVKTYVKDTIIPNWFQYCNSNLLDFLSILDVVSFKAEPLQSVLAHLYTLKAIPRTELIEVVKTLETESGGKRVIPINELKPEAATVWASAVQHLGFEDCDSVLLPELTQFAKYISKYCSEANLKVRDDQYVLMQLIEIGKCYSFMDEMGRKQLTQTCIDILKIDDIGVEVIPPIISLIEMLVTNVKERMAIMAELISDIREPLETENENAVQEINWDDKDSPKNNETDANISVDEIVKDANISVDEIVKELSGLNCKSQSLEDSSREERTDPHTLIKCLAIIKEMLKCPSINKIDATLLSLKEHFIVKCFNSTDGRVLSLAADCLGLLCIWSLDISKEFFLKFCILIANDTASVSAIEAVFDILLFHGFEPFSFGFSQDDKNNKMSELGEFLGEGSALDFTKDPTFSPTMRKIVPLLASLLQSHMREVKCKVSEGLSKLLLSSRIDSPIVLAHLILLWFSPAIDREPMIRQPLGMFFSVFSSRRIGAPDVILQAFIPTLRGAEELHDELIDQGKIANLFVTLLRSDISNKIGKQKGDKGSYHGQLALIILDEIRQELIPIQILAKALSGIYLEESDGVIADKLSIQALRTFKWLTRRSGERRILNIISKFKDEADKIKEKFDEKNKIVEQSSNESVIKEQKKDEEILSLTKGKRNTNKSASLTTEDSDRISIKGKEKNKGTEKAEEETMDSTQERLSEITTKSKPEITIVDESTSFESDDNTSLKRLPSHEPDLTIEKSPTSSEDMMAPSPPKRRLLRSCKK